MDLRSLSHYVLRVAASSMPTLSRQACPSSVLVHSDRGSQYASRGFMGLVESLGYERSMSAKGNCYENATMESFFGVIKREELDR